MIQVISHRGAAGLVPENTLPGFEKAIELGADWSELDVQLTRDRRLVVMHDDKVDRTTNGTGAVAEMTFDEIRALDAGDGERVPTLFEVLDVCRVRMPLHIELKGPGTEEPSFEAVRAAGMAGEVVFTSFELDRIARIKAMDSALPTCALFYEPKVDACRRALDAGAAGIGVYWEHITPQMVAEAHESGLEIGAWNPDCEADWRTTIALGVDIIGSNHPEGLIRLLREMGLR
jgi:glycerophosphoryl diester phosphodiesterase